MSVNVNEVANLIVELIELNESILNITNHDDLMSKRSKSLTLYDQYEEYLDSNDLTESEHESLELLNSYLHHTTIEVNEFLRKRLINLRIKERILYDRRKFSDF